MKRYPGDVQSQAVAEVERRRLLNPRDRTIYREVSAIFNVGEQSLRLWVKKQDAQRLGLDSAEMCDPAPGDMAMELDELRRRIQKLQVENDLLKRAFIVFSKEWSE